MFGRDEYFSSKFPLQTELQLIKLVKSNSFRTVTENLNTFYAHAAINGSKYIPVFARDGKSLNS